MHNAVKVLGGVLVAVLAAGCRSDSPQRPDLGTAVPEDCPQTTGADWYLPRGALVPTSDLGRTLRDVYASLLRGMSEPSLYCDAPGRAEVYRLARIEWVGVPVVVRVEVADSTPSRLTVLKLEAPAWNLPPGRVFERRDVILDADEREQLVTTLKRSLFWAMPTIGSDVDAAVGGGTTWILEWRQDARYHVVSRWQPKAGPFAETAHLLLRLAGVSENDLGPEAPNVPMRPPRPQPGHPPPPSPEERPR
jgi:hypothetical protein